MVAFIASLVVTAIFLAIYHWYASRRSLDAELTWGEAMVAAVFVFAVFFWVYGVVPHFWLTWADTRLGWRPDRLLEGPDFGIFDQGIVADQNNGGWMPFTLHYEILRDLIAVGIYVVFLGGNIWYWKHWQSRKARADAAEQADAAPSEFGRPLIREGVR